jgi:hypothetical protein
MEKVTSIINTPLMKYLLITAFVFFFLHAGQSQITRIVFTSDLHYGVTRPHFRGEDSVPSFIVNAAQVGAIKTLPHIDAVIVTGDIANREEKGIQSAADSWKQFLVDYKHGLKTKLWVTPGNHDASNAAGHPKIMFRDASSMTGMVELEKGKHIDTASYDYKAAKLNYSRNLGGVHCMFINLWPDSANRVWMEKDLAKVGKHIPVLIFTHDQPQGDPKHFTAGTGAENLLAEIYKDTVTGSTLEEQKGFTAFLKIHPNIKAYFHGHENFCEMYSYDGLPVFRSDSPVKGKQSREDETKLSFQLITIDARHHSMMVKECLWNARGQEGKIITGRTVRVIL